ncbi:ras association domain-containing protein 9 [Brachionichthys hirsutus]|uniref:ras association domain-containing protein 9 n=1 Tax=Brachionichthys hirsutus TaxID=412623 RepID=UPI0036047E93
MAPFGKSFLKARLKNRTKSPEPAVGKEIQVTVCSEEKAVCGVTKHTTCADLIQALLDDHKSVPERRRVLNGDAKDFCLVERWKGFERALPPLTRILRLCYAWGDQRPFIQFVLFKTSDFVPQPTKKGWKSKGAKQTRWEQSRTLCPQALPVEKQKRIVKKAFRKLEKLHKETRSSPGAEEIAQMVQLILNQDHTIREQIQRMGELDLEIERCDVEEQNEVEPESLAAQASGQSLEADDDTQLQECLYTCDGIKQLELQVQRHRKLILQLSRDIDAELRKASIPPSRHEGGEQAGPAAAAPWVAVETDESLYAAELERLQDELRRSLFAGVSLHCQAAEVDKQLRDNDAALASKDQECWQLAAHLNSLQIQDREEEEQRSSAPLKGDAPCSVSRTATLKHSLSPLDITDTDSDTGISSTHSQDSLSPCLDFPPPLDTDV